MSTEKRLIDANAEIVAIKKYACEGCENYNGIKCKACWADDLISWIEDAPKVDAVEVVHGRWIEDYVYAADPHDRLRYKCSVCGRTEEDKEPYCHCGAKMDGDGNDI